MATEKEKEEQIVVPGYLKFSKVITWIVYFWVMLGVITLAFRVFLLASGANANSGFVELIYEISGDYLEPFRGIWEPRPVGETGYLDVAALFSIIVYLLLAWGVHSLIDYIQNKIDRTKAAQEAELKKAERQKELAAQRKAAAARQSANTQKKTN